MRLSENMEVVLKCAGFLFLVAWILDIKEGLEHKIWVMDIENQARNFAGPEQPVQKVPEEAE
ncbi:MAG: hypothetical protein NE327_06305 [Lentisphaeraceae bacterium]|nr:hypothetical protein [Lentisphaeraceae bacterium]